jgi:thermostable 8-oxoguanine DNA glycosylase
MIEPTKITNHDRTYDELIEFLTFCICVAGKNSDAVAKKINALTKERDFLYCMYNYPLEENGLWEYTMLDLLFKHRVGQYKRIMRALRQVAQLDLQNCTLEELMQVKGIGPKTACFFILHSRPNQELVVIDTHILKWYSKTSKKAFKRPPSKWTDYVALAKAIVRAIRRRFPNMTLAEADLNIWKISSGRA